MTRTTARPLARRRRPAINVSTFTNEFIDPYDPADLYLWTKVEHLGRYLWVRDVLRAELDDGQYGAATDGQPDTRPSTSHLEVGCGTGYGMEILSGAVGRITGIDYDERALERSGDVLAQHPDLPCQLVLLDLDSQQITDAINRAAGAPFDSITAFEVLEHVDDGERLLAGIAAVSKPGTRLFLSVPNSRYEHRHPDGSPANAYHDRIYELDEVLGMLDDAGFTVNRVLGQAWVNQLLQGEKAVKGADRDAPRPSLNPALHERAALNTLSLALGLPNTVDTNETYAYTIDAVRR